LKKSQSFGHNSTCYINNLRYDGTENVTEKFYAELNNLRSCKDNRTQERNRNLLKISMENKYVGEFRSHPLGAWPVAVNSSP
jgi:hypothetical protein